MANKYRNQVTKLKRNKGTYKNGSCPVSQPLILIVVAVLFLLSLYQNPSQFFSQFVHPQGYVDVIDMFGDLVSRNTQKLDVGACVSNPTSVASIGPHSFSFFPCISARDEFLSTSTTLSGPSLSTRLLVINSLFGVVLKCIYFAFTFIGYFLCLYKSRLAVSSHTSSRLFHCLLASIVSVQKSVISIIVYMIFLTSNF